MAKSPRLHVHDLAAPVPAIADSFSSGLHKAELAAGNLDALQGRGNLSTSINLSRKAIAEGDRIVATAIIRAVAVLFTPDVQAGRRRW